jgi:hypothetical protein
MQNLMDWILGGFVNWKTTVTGIVTAILVLLNGTGYIHLTENERATVVAALIIVFSWFAKDSNQTGKPTDSK